MPAVEAFFANSDQATTTLEALRTGRFDTQHIKLVAGPEHTAEFGVSTGTASVAAGPTEPLVGGLLQTRVSPDDLRSIEQRLDQGGVLLLAEDLSDDEAQRLSATLREHGAERVEVLTG
jgi:hypothetical protein